MRDAAKNKKPGSKPLLSVLLPVLNGSDTIRDAIESLINQDFKDFEILVIDGGSSDGTHEIVNEYQRNDPRLKLYKKDIGLGDSLNFLLRIAKGSFSARMDADDISLPSRFSSQIELLKARKDVVLVGTQISYIVGDKVITRTPYSRDHLKILSDLENGIFSLAHPSIMFRTDDARSIGGYRETGIGEDLQFFLDLSQKGKLANTDNVGLLYRYAPGSITSDPTKAEMIEMRYAYTLKKWHSNNDSLSFKEFSNEWKSRPRFKKVTSWFGRKGNFLYFKYLIHHERQPFLSYFFLILSAFCKPHAVLRHLIRRLPV